MTGSTLLAHLVGRLAAHRNEDIVTEALAHICTESEAARSALSEFAAGLGAGAELARVETQQPDTDTASRPDLVAYDTEGRAPLIVEAKFDAGLTEQQPAAYLSQTDGVVLFVCPNRRIESLWPELLQRTKHLGAVDEGGLSRLTRRADVPGSATLAITSWGSLLNHIRNAVAVEHPSLIGDVYQLQNLCGRLESEAFLPLRSEELTADIGTRLVQFLTLIDELSEQLLNRADVNKERLRTGGRAATMATFLT